MKRREFLKGTSYAATFMLMPSSVFKSLITSDNKDDLYVYIGTYTTKGSEGIYICRYNQLTGQLSLAGVEKGVTDPSFLAVDPGKKFLFAVNEVGEFNGKKGGGVSAFRIDKQTGMLSFINNQSSGGAAPCNLTVNMDGSFVLVGNYSGGNVSVLPVKPDGSLGSLVGLIQHTGSGINLKRQKTPHVHCLVLDRSNKHIIVTDLGTDKIIVYPFDAKKGGINESGKHSFSAHPGAGPRHLAFSPDEKFLYAINELNSTITVYMYDGSEGNLTEIQTLPTLPAEFSGSNTCADIHVHPSGKFLYGSNRGHDSIAAYKRDQQTGMLSLIELVSTKGKNPRNFAIDPAGNFLLVANQDTNNIVSFRIDPETGRLNPSESSIDIPTPVCIRFL
jgi:6-phosphogluconolactonase